MINILKQHDSKSPSTNIHKNVHENLDYKKIEMERERNFDARTERNCEKNKRGSTVEQTRDLMINKL